ncbi:MAG: hypothetical protein LBK65_04290, partial [Tannerellaceae bacterium]|nr:hypothetical protein [Tannerellaceae bacterium]
MDNSAQARKGAAQGTASPIPELQSSSTSATTKSSGRLFPDSHGGKDARPEKRRYSHAKEGPGYYSKLVLYYCCTQRTGKAKDR